MSAPETKRCTKCGEVKPGGDYYRRKDTADGFRADCKACRKAMDAERYAADSEYVKARQRAYTRNNGDAVRARDRARYAADPTPKRKSAIRWHHENPDKSYAVSARKRARRRGVLHESYSRGDIFARWSGACTYCDAPADALDHVTPISAGGADAEWNLVPACTPCNSSKGAKSLADWATTF